MAQKDQCNTCGKSLVSTRAGSFTSYLFQQNYCQCNSQKKPLSSSSDTASLVCRKCGKSVAKRRAGSFTSFLFQELRCHCAQPSLAKKSLSKRTNTQTRRQAIDEMRGCTANFKAQAESSQRLPDVDFAPGTIIGGVFEIAWMVGEGGMGKVYLADHLSLGRPFALKILSPSIVSEQSWLRFKAEAKTLAALNHPGLVRVYDLGIHANTVPYYSMDYLKGQTLEDLLMRKGPLKFEQAMTTILAVLDALAYAHRNNIVHRDIKPANIFICQTKEIKILDFGISKLVGEKGKQELTAVGEVFGSPYYMSPEQCRGEPIDFRSDIYSAGCTLFETLTGYVPFESDSSLEIAMLHEECDIPLLSDVCDMTFSSSLDVVMAKCLAKLPQDRYQSAKEMAIDLTRIKEGKNLEVYAGAAKSKKSVVGAELESGAPVGLIGPGLLALLALSLAGMVVFAISFQPIGHRNKLVEGKTLVTMTPRDLLAVTDESAGLLDKEIAPKQVDVKSFLAKPFKPFSEIVKTKGEKTRLFTFPPGISLGMLYWKNGDERFRHEASGTVAVPAQLPVAFSSNATVQLYPKLLNYFRCDDLRKLDLSAEQTSVDLSLAAVSKLTSLESLTIHRMVLTTNSPSYLNRLTRLKSLDFKECQIEPEIFAKILPVGKVEDFKFDGGRRFSPQLNVIAQNRIMTALTVTSSTLSKADVKALASMRSLKMLSLKYGSLTNADLKELTSLQNLQELDISYNNLNKNCIETLFKFPNLIKLTITDLSVDDEQRLRNALPKLQVIE